MIKLIFIGMIIAGVGDLIAAQGYWLMNEYKLSVIFVLYSITTFIFATIVGVK